MNSQIEPYPPRHRIPAWPILGVFAFSAVWLLGRTRRREDRMREDALIAVVARSYDLTLEEARARVERENARMDEVRRALTQT